MSAIGKILAYTLFLVVVACILAPPLYWAGQWALDQGWLPILKSVRFFRYFNRTILIVMLLTLWPFLRWLGLRHWTELGLAPNQFRARDIGMGVVIGIIGLWLVGFGLVVAGHAVMKEPLPYAKLFPILLTATVVPIIEEPFFRGALFGLVRRMLNWRLALLFVSLFFAVLHFVKPGSGPRITDVKWHSGFSLLPNLFQPFQDPEHLVGGFVTLFLVGWVLGYCVVKTQSLYLSIGLHAGWVFALRSFSSFTRRVEEPSLWVGKDITTGLVPVALVLCTFVLLCFLFEKTRGPWTKNI